MLLDNEDNEIVRRHLYEANKSLPVWEKVAMNVFIHGIDIDGEEITFHTTTIEPILDEENGMTRDVTGEEEHWNPEKIGKQVVLTLETFESPIKESIRAAIREIQIRKIGI